LEKRWQKRDKENGRGGSRVHIQHAHTRKNNLQKREKGKEERAGRGRENKKADER
jgi:hypothetical protein